MASASRSTAHGYARDGGRDYRWILDHYYTGTTLGAAEVGRVRVLVASGVGRVTVGSAAAFTVTSANGRTFNLSAGTHTIRANLQVRTANGTLRTLVGPLRFDPGTAVLRLSGNGYRGRIRVRGGLVSAVNDVGLEQYIKGVVAWEMPASWHPRHSRPRPSSRARTGSSAARPASGSTCTTTRGARSTAASGPRTRGRARPWRRRAARSSGRRRARVDGATRPPAEDRFARGRGPPGIPYLVGVEDAFDAISPHHVWGSTDAEDDRPNSGRDCVCRRLRSSALGSRAPSSITDFVVAERNGSSRVARTRLTAVGRDDYHGRHAPPVLRLRSTWFSIGVLRLNGAGRIRQGQARTPGCSPATWRTSSFSGRSARARGWTCGRFRAASTSP